MVTRKLKQETGLLDSESAIGFVIRSTVPPFWVFLDSYFAHSDRNRPVGLVNVVNGSVETVALRRALWQPVIVTSSNGR